MLRALYHWTMSLASSPRANIGLAVVSFAESSFFPIPPDVLLLPMVLADRQRAWRIALICTLASVAGAVLGYAIGAVLFEQLAMPVLNFYGYGERFSDFAEAYHEWGPAIVLMAGLTPFPFKVITIASGATGMDLPIFLAAAVVARGIRFYAVAALLYWFGPPVRAFIEKRLTLVFCITTAVFFAGFAAARLLVH